MTSRRIVLASIVIGLSLAGAAWIHGAKLGHRVVILVPASTESVCTGGYRTLTFRAYTKRLCRTYTAKAIRAETERYPVESGWQDPLAIFLAVAGVGAGAAILAGSGLRPRGRLAQA